MPPLSPMLIAITIAPSRAECHDVGRTQRGNDVEIDGRVYVDHGGNYVCGFYGTLQCEGRIIGCEINLFPDYRPTWQDLKKFKSVEFTADEGPVRIVWGPVGRGELVSGGEEWFQRCALLRAGPDAYCIILDFPATANERLVVTERRE